MAALKIKAVAGGARLEVFLVGRLDEDSDFSAISWQGVEAVTFDFDGVGLMNSMGVLRWTRFFAGIPATVGIAFRNCRGPIVAAMNQLNSFTGGRKVDIVSFYAPFYCEPCAHGFEALVRQKVDAAACPGCQGSANLDEHEAGLFKFLETHGTA